MAASRGTSTASLTPATTTNTFLDVTGLSTTVGDVNVVELSGFANGTAVNPTVTTPTGWTKVGENMQATGTPATWIGIYWRAVQSGDSSTQRFSWANAGNMVAVATPWSGADTGSAVPWSVFANKAASNTSYAITGTTTAAGTLNYGFACRTSPGTWSGGTIASDTVKASPALSSSAAMTAVLQVAQVASGAAVSKSATGPSTSIGQQWAYVVKDASFAPGSAAFSGSGSLSAAVETPAQAWVRVHSGGTQYVAHRNGFWNTYGEETLEGYQAAASYHSGLALEVSVQDTSDGVYVCSHDGTTGRVFSGTNRTINSTTWATFSPNGSSTVGRPTTLVGGNPMRRLEEILDAFPTRIFVVENKHGTNEATLAALLEAHAPGRWIFKGPYNDTANANTASTYRCPIWLFWYAADFATTSNLTTCYSNLSTAIANGSPIIFGLGDYSTSPVPVQSDANTFYGFTVPRGIKSWAHILGTTAQRSTADGQALSASTTLDGYMMKDVASIIASDATSGGASLSGAGTLSASAVPSPTSSPQLSGTGTLTATATPATAAVAALSGSGALTASAAPSTAATAALSGTGTLTTSSRAGTAGSAALSGAGSLTASAVPAASAAATFSGTGSLSASAAPAWGSGAALSGSGTLSATARPVTVATASLAGSGTLATSASASTSSIAALTGTGTLTTVGASGGSVIVATSGTGTLTASAAPSTAATAALAGVGTLTTAGASPAITGTAVFSGVGSLVAVAAAAAVTGTPLLTGDGHLTATATAVIPAGALLTGAGTLVATSRPAAGPTPPERTYAVPAENRTITVPPETRLVEA